MNEELVRLSVSSDGYPVIKHIRTGNMYRLLEITQVKINDVWVDVAHFSGSTGKFGRLLDDFSGFEYLFNDINIPVK
tara:strand:- start:1226 stop:1456 length:231 start_codon:yes stop_codon:yes gene_type:complete